MISVAYVEADLHIALMVCLLCQRQGGITMHPLSSGHEALEMLSRSPVDVIISGSDLPGMTGIELLATLRSRGDLTPVILFTGTADTGEIIRAVNRYPAVRILSWGNTVHGQFPRLVMMIRMVAQHSAVLER
ncbi:MAG: response regulator [Methanoregula sp.]|nr:response regulator [Methanoregula sp.]